MKIFKRIITIITALMLVTGLNVGLSYAATDSQKTVESSASTSDGISNYIDTIENSNVKEKISDLLDVEYLELVVEEEKATKTGAPVLNEADKLRAENEIALNDVKELSKLEDKQLDKAITNRIQDVIDEDENNDNIIILPSSYETLEQYGFADKVAELKNTEQKAAVSSTGSILTDEAATAAGSYKGWEKNATGYLRNAAKEKTASYTINVQWFINSSKKIYYWDTNQSHKIIKARYYSFIKNTITSQKTYDSGKALLITGDGKFKKKNPVPGLVPNYNHIIIDIECSNTGGFDFNSSTRATYD